MRAKVGHLPSVPSDSCPLVKYTEITRVSWPSTINLKCVLIMYRAAESQVTSPWRGEATDACVSFSRVSMVWDVARGTASTFGRASGVGIAALGGTGGLDSDASGPVANYVDT